MIEKNGVNQMLEKHVETRSDEYWKKIIEDFQKIHENEERMERQLELEEIQRLKDTLNSILASQTGQDVKTIEKDTDRDNFMSAAEACKYGLIDEVIEKHK